MNCELGKALAINTVDQPWPHPTSATLAPRCNFSTTPSSAGSQLLTKLFVVAGAEKACNRAEKAACVIAPRHAGTGREHRLDLILALGHPCHQVECSHHVDGA